MPLYTGYMSETSLFAVLTNMRAHTYIVCMFIDRDISHCSSWAKYNHVIEIKATHRLLFQEINCREGKCKHSSYSFEDYLIYHS